MARSQNTNANDPAKVVADQAPDMASLDVRGECAPSSKNVSANEPDKVVADWAPKMAPSNAEGECTASLSAAPDWVLGTDYMRKQIKMPA